MSNLKNVMKAGFLLSSSLFITACFTDPATPAAPSGSGTGGSGAPVASDDVSRMASTRGVTAVPGDKSQAVSAAAPAAAAAAGGTGGGAPAVVVEQKAALSSPLTASATTAVKPEDLSNTLLLETNVDTSNITVFDPAYAQSSKIGGIVFEGQTSAATAKGRLKANASIDALYLRSAALDAETSVTATSLYANVGAGSSLGKNVVLNVKGADGEDSVWVKGGLLANKYQGEFDIAGSVANLVTEKTIVTSTNATAVTLQPKTASSSTEPAAAPQPAAANLEISAPATALAAAATTASTGVSKKSTKPNSSAIMDPNTSAPATATKDALLKAVKPKVLTPAPKSKADKSVATKKTVKSGKAQPASSTDLVFNMEVASIDSVAHIGNWTANSGSILQAVGQNVLVVDNLTLNDNVGLHVFAKTHTFEKIDVATIEALGNGQTLMGNLKPEGAPTYPIVESSETVSGGTYKHFDSNVPFVLVNTGAATLNGKKFVLEKVELDKDLTLGKGVYVLPLVKHFTKDANFKYVGSALTLANSQKVTNWAIKDNGYFDAMLLVELDAAPAAAAALSSGVLSATLMASNAQAGRVAVTAELDATVAKLNPENMIANSFAAVSSARINQSAQAASLVRGVSSSSAETFGDVSNYAVSFNHDGANVGFNYSVAQKGTKAFGANVATKVLGLTAIVSADASVDAGKNDLASASHNAFNAGVTLAKAYSFGGLSVVPMAGFGVSSNAVKGYAAAVDMAAGKLGLYLDNVAFNAATYNVGVNVALDESVANTLGADASVAFGVAGYLAADAEAELSTSEGATSALKFGGSSVAPYAQFNLGLANGATANAILSTGIVAVNFGLNR